MKLIHLSDLHLGKRINEYPMLEDQRHILDRILQIIAEERPDAVLLAGDIYDKSIPSVEAVELCDDFLYRLSALGQQTFVISGNHDSPERLSFCARLMEGSGMHIAPAYQGKTEPITLWDAHGPVDIYLLPFVKPATVRRFFPEAEIDSYQKAVATAISAMPMEEGRRKVLVAHQYVTGATLSDSEELSVGGAENVDAALFDAFDYVALGHIHRPQNVSGERLRYCGTPLKYSISEEDAKSVTVAELGQRGELSLRLVPLVPLRDMLRLTGTYEELTAKTFYQNTSLQEDYVYITLTDEEEIPFAFDKLRVIYHNLMQLQYSNTRSGSQETLEQRTQARTSSPLALFADFYQARNGMPMGEAQQTYMQQLIESIWEEQG